MTLAPAAEQPLGINTKYASTLEDKKPGNEPSPRVRRFALQSVARKLLPNERVAWCLRRLNFDERTVEIWYAENPGRAHLKHVSVCGSVWTCPVCAAKISERRRIEMTDAIENNPELTPILVTFTFQHNRSDQLSDLVETLNTSYRKLKSGRAWKSLVDDYGLVASVTGLELTWGHSNGWHPHKHALFFSTLKPGEFDLDELQSRLAARFQAIMERSGHYSSSLYGVDVRAGNGGAADYVSKWGIEHEIAKSPVKKGRGGFSPFQLLELYASGKKWAGALFQEYARTMKGRRQLVWSKGGRALLGLTPPEQSDQELAEAPEEESTLLLQLTWSQYLVILNSLRPGIIGEMLEVASIGDPVRLWAFLVGLGVKPNENQMDLAIFHDTSPPPATRPIKLAAAPAKRAAAPAEDLSELKSLEESNPLTPGEAKSRNERVMLGMAALSHFAKLHPRGTASASLRQII